MTLAIRLKNDELRNRIHELLARDHLTEREKHELNDKSNRLAQNDNLLRSERWAGEFGAPVQDAEARELSRVLAGVSVAECIENVLTHRAADGRLAEVQAHYGLAGNEIPVELLRPQNAVTPAPAETQANQNAILQPVFADGDAAYLSIPMPVVAAGDSVFPVLTNRPTVTGPVSDSTAAPETTGSFTAQTLAPERLQASFYWRRTDAARFVGMEEALRQALASALGEALDKQIVATVLAGTTAVTTSAQDTFPTYRQRLVYDRIDARFATVESDLRALVGPAVFGHMSNAYRSDEAPDTALSAIRAAGTPVRTSAHIPAVASKQQPVIVRRGMRADAVAPIWRNLVLIADEVTRAGTGEVQITAVAMANFAVLRADGFAKVNVQTSA